MKATIKLFFLALLMLPMAAIAQGGEEIAIPLTNPGQAGKLKVGLVYGSIRVIGYDGRDVLVSYDDDGDDRDDRRERRNSSNRQGLRRIANTSVGLEASERNNEVKISISGVPKDIDLLVRVPKNFSLNLSTVNNGDIVVENVAGEHEISNVNGDVDMVNVEGSVLVNTVNGDIDVEFNAIQANAPMSFTTVNGDIDLSLPPTVQFDAKIKTEWGDIFSDFDFVAARGSSNPKTTRKSGQYKVTLNKWVIGTINGGGPEYTFTSLHGDVVIRKN